MTQRRSRWRWLAVALAAVAAISLLAGYQFWRGGVVWTPKAPAADDYRTGDWTRILRAVVDEGGCVDYRELARRLDELDQFVATLAVVSPDSRPERFDSDDARLAYWINAYNACVLYAVARQAEGTGKPPASVRDVEPPFGFGWLPPGAGFFWFQRVRIGGVTFNLYQLEHDVVRRRFAEPRIHFALNCASRGCPPLQRAAYEAASLETVLQRVTARFLADETNLAIDEEARTVSVTSLLDWYAEDFVRGDLVGAARDAALMRWMVPFAGARASKLERAIDAGFELRFLPYDWTLNARPD